MYASAEFYASLIQLAVILRFQNVFGSYSGYKNKRSSKKKVLVVIELLCVLYRFVLSSTNTIIVLF